MIRTKASAVIGPTPGWIISSCTSGRRSASCAIALLNSSIIGLSRSSNSKSSCRRRLVQGASGNDSKRARPFLLHSPFFPRSPSFMAIACNWFMTRVCIPTNRWRCNSSCRTSRFSGLGIQILGERSSISSLRMCSASSRSFLCFRTRLARICAGSPTHSSKPSSASKRSNQRECPVASIPTPMKIAAYRVENKA